MDAQITVRLPQDLAQALERLAAERGIGRSELLRQALRAYLEGPTTAETERPFDRVRDLAGFVYGGPPDLGASHREYLKEIFGGR